jgi:ActR/RegA family two-component response regulator
MGTVYLANALSISMFEEGARLDIALEPVHAADIADLLALRGFTSVVGHADTADVLSEILGTKVAHARVDLRLETGDVLYVAQLRNGRLAEGAKTLPPGARFSFCRVRIK